jgi:hypothetical protein
MSDLTQQIRDRCDDPVDCVLSPQPYADAVRAVLELHTPKRIYDECGHVHTPEEPGISEVNEIGLVCDDGYMYTVCGGCCSSHGYQSENCADSHDHTVCWPCLNVQAIADKLGIEVPS